MLEMTDEAMILECYVRRKGGGGGGERGLTGDRWVMTDRGQCKTWSTRNRGLCYRWVMGDRGLCYGWVMGIEGCVTDE